MENKDDKSPQRQEGRNLKWLFLPLEILGLLAFFILWAIGLGYEWLDRRFN